VLSAACAGFAGGLYAQIRGTVALDLLSVDLSLLIIIIAAFGGAGSIIGPALGAYVVVLLQNYYLDRAATVFAEHPEIKIGAFALLLIVVLIVQPRGLVPPLLQRLSGRGSASRGGGRDHGRARRRAAVTALLEVDAVTRRFGGLTAVNDVTFSVEQGAASV
jgi:branched-chain amino acid transport system permease protein